MCKQQTSNKQRRLEGTMRMTTCTNQSKISSFPSSPSPCPFCFLLFSFLFFYFIFFDILLDVRKAGFKSFNMDLMYGFPVPKSGSTFPQTVKDVVALQPVCFAISLSSLSSHFNIFVGSRHPV